MILKEIEEISIQYNINKVIYQEQVFELTENLCHGTENRIVEKFSCLICLNIVNDPVKCGQCSRFYCLKCIEENILYKDQCPNCLSSPFKKDKIDIFIKDLLYESEFKCPMNCGKIIKYCQQEIHKKECLILKKMNQCSLCKINLQDENLNIHKQKCVFLKTNCFYCNEDLNKLDYKIHLVNCPKQLKLCNIARIYFPIKYDEAYEDVFKYLITNYHSYHQKLKNLSQIS